jgi:hypothetical protein
MMSKDEAIEQMKLGHKLTHRHFTNDEWIKTNQKGEVYIFEDGVEWPKYEFWLWRTDKSWESDWELYKS